MVDAILDWFCQYRDVVAITLIGAGILINIGGFVAKIGCIAFSIGGAMILIGVLLFLINCP